MTRDLDEILSGAEPAQETSTAEPIAQVEAPSEPQDQGQPRAADGKFASKASDAIEQQAQATVEGTAPQAERQHGMVPQPALHAARETAKTERDRADRLERQLAELTGKVSVLTTMRDQPQPQAEQPKPKDFWEDPDNYVQTAVAPIQQQMERQRLDFSKALAMRDHGEETLKSAFDAFGEAVRSDPSAQHEYKRIMASAHPYDELVSWHKRTSALSEIGADPNAYRERVKAELMAELGLAAGTPPATAAASPSPVMPSNLAGARNVGTRSGPAWSGPKPLNDIFDRSRKSG